MDDLTFDVLSSLSWHGLLPIRFADFEAGDGALAAAKANRSTIEYYFTCTPSLPLYVLKKYPEIKQIFYVDADCYFLSDANVIADEMGSGSVYVVEHRFSEALRDRAKYGRFNVGILGFRNDSLGRNCLETWRRQCNEWCYDRLEDDRFADQKYLDDWPRTVARLVVAAHPGVNLAPWNRANYRLAAVEGVPHVDGFPVVCYHFHGLRLRDYGLMEPQHGDYGGRLNDSWIKLIYEPYLQELLVSRHGLPVGDARMLRYATDASARDLLASLNERQLLLRILGRVMEPPTIVLRCYLLGIIVLERVRSLCALDEAGQMRRKRLAKRLLRW